jgi:hypothetical protein
LALGATGRRQHEGRNEEQGDAESQQLM